MGRSRTTSWACLLLASALVSACADLDDDDSAEVVEASATLELPFSEDFEGSPLVGNSSYWSSRYFGITEVQAASGTQSLTPCYTVPDDCEGQRPAWESWPYGLHFARSRIETALPLDLTSGSDVVLRLQHLLPHVPAVLQNADEVEDPGSSCPVIEGRVGDEGEAVLLARLCTETSGWELLQLSLEPLSGAADVFLEFRVPEYWTRTSESPTEWFIDDVLVE